jgi:hypothetical protein
MLVLQEYKGIFEKKYKVEFVKQVKDVTEFFNIIKKNFESRILNKTKDEILLIFDHLMIMNEFIKNLKVFYPNPLEMISNETQHLMKGEPIYSFFGDSVLIGTLNNEDTIQFGDMNYNQHEFRKLHWGIIPKELKYEYRKTSFNNCKVKRGSEFINIFHHHY